MRTPNQIEHDIQNLLSKPAATARHHKGMTLGISVLVLLVAQFFVIVNMSGNNQSLIKKVSYYEKGFNGYRVVGFDMYDLTPRYECAKPEADDKVSI